MLSIDVKRAYFYAAARSKICIEIAMENWQPGDAAKVAKLNLSFYGTRDAAQTWTEEYARILLELGFVAGLPRPATFCVERENSASQVTAATLQPPGRWTRCSSHKKAWPRRGR